MKCLIDSSCKEFSITTTTITTTTTLTCSTMSKPCYKQNAINIGSTDTETIQYQRITSHDQLVLEDNSFCTTDGVTENTVTYSTENGLSL